LSITKAGNVGEGWSMNIGANMPFGTKGIKKIDFITGLQKKFNLVMYPSRTKQREFIVETFNSWYNKGRVWDFNQFVNLNEKLEVIPANNLAVNELNFGDLLDNDYISQQFSKAANREYGKTYYIDTQNFFSQGNFEVKTSFASSPIIYLDGTGVSGSVDFSTNYQVSVQDNVWDYIPSTCYYGAPPNTVVNRTTATLLDANGNPTINYADLVTVVVKYDAQTCYGYSYPDIRLIYIPYGASSGYVEYYSLQYVDCGLFSCDPEYITIDCVDAVEGASLYPSSPISAC